MSASYGGRDEPQGELENRDSSDSPVKQDNRFRSPAARRTDVDDGVSSVSSASSKILGTKPTAQSVVPWKQELTCPMDGPSMLVITVQSRFGPTKRCSWCTGRSII